MMEMATGQTKAEQKEQEAKAKKNGQKTEKAEKKEQPSYPKWPEDQPASYTQTIRDRATKVMEQVATEGFQSQNEGVQYAIGQVLPKLEEREQLFKAAGAKSWILKSELAEILRSIQQSAPDVVAPKGLQAHVDLTNLYRRGVYFGATYLAKEARVEL